MADTDPSQAPVQAAAEPLGQPLSIGQQALWLMYREDPASAAFNVSLPLRLRRSLDSALLQRALDRLLDAHPVLTGRFMEVEGQARCLPGGLTRMPLARAEPAADPAVEPTPAALIAQLSEHAAAPFDLAAGAVRALWLPGDGADLVMLSFHHLLVDGHSLALIGQQLVDEYVGLAGGEPPARRAVAADYADYVDWERTLLAGPRGARMEAYWRRRLDGPVPTLQLPADRPRPPVRRASGGAVAFEIDAALGSRLQALARDQRSRLVNVLLCAYQVLLRRCTAQERVWVGVPTAVARNEPRFAETVGYLVNLMVVTARFPADQDLSFTELLKATTAEMLASLFHQPYPFSSLVRQLRPPRDRSLTPLIQTTFSFTRETLLPNGFAADGLRAELIDLPQMAGQHDLALAFIRERPLRGLFLYNTDLFDRSTVERLAGQFRRLLGAIADDPQCPVDSLALLSTEDLARLRALNRQDAPPAPGPALMARFEAQVARTPGRPALLRSTSEHPGGVLTYAELNAAANRVACTLAARGIRPGDRVGVCLPRELALVPCLLGILKAGAAYVPIDPAYPQQRLAGMLDDGRIRLLLTRTAVLDRHPWLRDHPGLTAATAAETTARHDSGAILNLDAHSPLGQGPDPGNPPPPEPAPELAYILFTSGSTGRPKGVMIRHAGVAALLDWALATYPPAALAGVLASTSINFDLSVFELFVPLAAGGTVILAENALELPSLPERDRVTLINTVPSAMAELVRNAAVPASVRIVNLAGEPLKRTLVQAVYATGRVQAVYNLYGPSEDTTYSTWALIDRDDPGEPTIGRPVSHTRAYILDPRLQPLPPGLPGELCLAGAGLAAGYQGRADLTAERFVEVAPLGRPERVYRTGDLARWRADGRLEFLGRIDHQIKLRGYRIELGEIEAALTRQPDVDDAVVVLDDNAGNPRLLAYVGSPRGDTLREALTASLRERLPDYMIPGLIQVLPALPLTPNGKIDRLRLPAPQAEQSASQPPRDDTEQRVAAAWREVLEVEKVGIDDSFFDLGGHSLLLLRLQLLLRADYPTLGLMDLFGYPTVRLLAARLRELAAGGCAPESGGGDQGASRRAAERQAHLAALKRRRGA